MNYCHFILLIMNSAENWLSNFTDLDTYKKWIRRFVRSPILLSKEVLLNFSCGMVFPLPKRIECYKSLWWWDYVTKKIWKWYKAFKEGGERVDGFQPSGRPSISIDDQNINEIKEMVLGNCRLTIRELVDMVVNFIWISANNFEGSFGSQKSQIEFGAEISQFLRKTASRSSMWNNALYLLKIEAKPKRPGQSCSKIKVMLTVFFDYFAWKIRKNYKGKAW